MGVYFELMWTTSSKTYLPFQTNPHNSKSSNLHVIPDSDRHCCGQVQVHCQAAKRTGTIRKFWLGHHQYILLDYAPRSHPLSASCLPGLMSSFIASFHQDSSAYNGCRLGSKKTFNANAEVMPPYSRDKQFQFLCFLFAKSWEASRYVSRIGMTKKGKPSRRGKGSGLI